MWQDEAIGLLEGQSRAMVAGLEYQNLSTTGEYMFVATS